MESLFSRTAQWIGVQLGKPHTFALACLTVVIWAASGPMFGYSDTWQLVINTGTTIVTFLMVFLLQHTQNRDTRVIHLKLDELIRSNENARNALLGLEELTENELRALQAKFAALAKIADISADQNGAPEDSEQAEVSAHDAWARFTLATQQGATEQVAATKAAAGGSDQTR